MSGGWFAVARDDLARIRDASGERDTGTLLAVWLAMLDIGNTSKSETFTATIGRVARTAGYSYRATAGALRRLESTGLLKITSRRLDGTNGHDASEYTIITTVLPLAVCAQPSAGSAEPSASPVTPILPTEIRRQQDNRDTRSKFTVPTESDCIAYATEIGLGKIEAEKFYDRNVAGGWMVGSGKMKDWRAAMRYWAKKARTYTATPRPTAPATGFVRRDD